MSNLRRRHRGTADNCDVPNIISIETENFVDAPPLITVNDFSLKGSDFVRTIRKMDFKSFENLMPIMKPLDRLTIQPGYEIDAFYCGSRLGAYLRLYCCRQGAIIMYHETEERKKGLFSFLMKKKNLPHNEYADYKYLQGTYSQKVDSIVPEVWRYITAEFSPMAVWQCYLLRIAHRVMPRRWHAIYGHNDYIFVVSDLEQRGVDLTGYCHDATVFPSVEVTGDNTATVSCCYWNDWQGLVREEIEVTFVEGHAQFGEGKTTVLVPYDCGIRW